MYNVLTFEHSSWSNQPCWCIQVDNPAAFLAAGRDQGVEVLHQEHYGDGSTCFWYTTALDRAAGTSLAELQHLGGWSPGYSLR